MASSPQIPSLPSGIFLEQKERHGVLTVETKSVFMTIFLLLLVVGPIALGALAIVLSWPFLNAQWALLVVVESIALFFALPLLSMSFSGKLVLTGNAQGCQIEQTGFKMKRLYNFEWASVMRINDSGRARGTRGRFSKGTKELGLHIHFKTGEPVTFGWGYLSTEQEEFIEAWLKAHLHYKD